MTRTVVHFVDTNTFGGCEEVMLILLAGLDKTRWRPVLFHHDAPGISRLLNGADRLGILCRSVPRLTVRNIVLKMKQFARELRAMEPDIFHVHLNWSLACSHAVTAARFSGVPAIVATSHLYTPISGVRCRLKQRLQAAFIDRYVAVSNEVKERLCQDMRIPGSKVRVVQNGVQLANFGRPPDFALRAMLDEGIDRPIVFTPARLHSQKGHVYLLEAAALVPDALFVLAGDGPERDRLEAFARRLGIEERVRFLGHRQDIPQLLANCDLFVLPSLYEGLPLTVLEAMAAGKPVVATDIGGTNEAVIHGATGLLVPPGSPSGLATAIRTILSDQGLAARLTKAAKERVVQEFSSDAMTHGVTRIYDELI